MPQLIDYQQLAVKFGLTDDELIEATATLALARLNNDPDTFCTSLLLFRLLSTAGFPVIKIATILTRIQEYDMIPRVLKNEDTAYAPTIALLDNRYLATKEWEAPYDLETLKWLTDEEWKALPDWSIMYQFNLPELVNSLQQQPVPQ